MCACLFMCMYTCVGGEARDQSQVLFSGAETLFLKIESLIGTLSLPSRHQQVPGITCWVYKHAPSCRAILTTRFWSSELKSSYRATNTYWPSRIPSLLVQNVYFESLESELCCKYHDTILSFWARRWESLWKRSPFHPRQTCSHPLLQCSELE